MVPSSETPGSNMVQWMDPLARDMIFICYAQIKPNSAALAAVASCHGMLWRNVLTGRNEADALRQELSRLSARASISESALEWVNRQVMAELLDTVAKRYTRSPREASRLSFEVARAACKIAQARRFDTDSAVSAPKMTRRKAGAVP
jgi:hypothetical protein